MSPHSLDTRTRQDCAIGNVRAICLDLDGTLYNQGSLRAAMLMRLVQYHLFRPLRGYKALKICAAYRRAQETLRSGDSRPAGEGIAEEQIRIACELSGEPREMVLSCVRRWFEREPLPLLKKHLRPGLAEFLSQARRRGIRLAVLSDYPAAGKLEAMGVARFFDTVVCAQDTEVQKFKPHPAGLHFILRCMGVGAGEALYVGDRVEVDVEAARRAGVRSVLIGGRSMSFMDRTLAVPDFSRLTAVMFP